MSKGICTDLSESLKGGAAVGRGPELRSFGGAQRDKTE